MSELAWYRLPDEVRAHAFVSGPGWMRAACGVRWTVRLVRASSRSPLCPTCVAAVDAKRPIEPVMDEAEARLVFGR